MAVDIAQGDTIRIAEIIAETEAEGPGLRSAVWLQGCTLRCPGCCNQEMWSPNSGIAWNVTHLADHLSRPDNLGLSILGGEPLDQARPLTKMLRRYRQQVDRSIWLFTGYTWDQVQESTDMCAVAALCDVVVAGPYRQEFTPDPRKWIGSTNQTIHFVTDRDRAIMESWPTGEFEVELHFLDGELVINGWPLPALPSTTDCLPVSAVEKNL